MLDQNRRARAEAFLPSRLRASIFNPQIRPHWIAGQDRFWYRRESPDGVQYYVVNAEDGSQTPAFDHTMIAGQLDANPLALPIADLDLPGQRLKHLDGRWFCWADGKFTPAPDVRAGETASPDGRWAVFCRGDNVWLREIGTESARQLTFNGAPHHAWGKSPDSNLTTISLRRRGLLLPANVLWSPDSQAIFTSQLDERAVLDLPLVQHAPGGARPILHNMKFALSGDADLPLEQHAAIDIATGTITLAHVGPHVTGMTTCIEKEEAWWSADASRVWFLDRDRCWQRLTLYELIVATGAVRSVISESATSFIDNNVSVLGLPNVAVLEDRAEVIWFSQRDGWGHLYRYDLATGALVNQITTGTWLVRDIVAVSGDQIEFLAGGITHNPTHRTLCRISLDGSGFIVLTPGLADQQLAMPLKRVPRDHIRPPVQTGSYRAPSGNFFVHTSADLVSLPVSTLRRADGTMVADIATASIADGHKWRWPTPFEVLADDGETILFGAMWLPTDFDPTKKYPVIDYIYPGPQRGMVPTMMLTDIPGEFSRAAMPQMFAELGFVVINVDGRGTPLRSKAFHDHSYGKLDDPGTLADHVATLSQLAAQHPWFDITRVGIMGHSGGGYATLRAMLEYPESFHAGISTSGNHDQMGYSFAWTEKYMGPVAGANYASASNAPLVSRLQGKLLLATGDMDDNVHPALTMQVAAALVAADKDFEFIPLPNDDHTTVWSNPYFLRRAMDFLVRSLGEPQ